MTNLEINLKKVKASDISSGAVFCVQDIDDVYLKLDDFAVKLRLPYDDEFYPNAVSLKSGELCFITNEAKIIEIKSAKLEIET